MASGPISLRGSRWPSGQNWITQWLTSGEWGCPNNGPSCLPWDSQIIDNKKKRKKRGHWLEMVKVTRLIVWKILSRFSPKTISKGLHCRIKTNFHYLLLYISAIIAPTLQISTIVAYGCDNRTSGDRYQSVTTLEKWTIKLQSKKSDEWLDAAVYVSYEVNEFESW